MSWAITLLPIQRSILLPSHPPMVTSPGPQKDRASATFKYRAGAVEKALGTATILESERLDASVAQVARARVRKLRRENEKDLIMFCIPTARMLLCAGLELSASRCRRSYPSEIRRPKLGALATWRRKAISSSLRRRFLRQEAPAPEPAFQQSWPETKRRIAIAETTAVGSVRKDMYFGWDTGNLERLVE